MVENWSESEKRSEMDNNDEKWRSKNIMKKFFKKNKIRALKKLEKYTISPKVSSIILNSCILSYS